MRYATQRNRIFFMEIGASVNWQTTSLQKKNTTGSRPVAPAAESQAIQKTVFGLGRGDLQK